MKIITWASQRFLDRYKLAYEFEDINEKHPSGTRQYHYKALAVGIYLKILYDLSEVSLELGPKHKRPQK